MKKLNSSVFIAFVCLIMAVSLTAAQDIRSNLYSPAPDGKEVFELWQEPQWDETLGVARNIIINNEGEVIVWNDKGYMVRLSQQGKLLGLVHGYLPTPSFIKDNIIYAGTVSSVNNRIIKLIKRYDSKGDFLDEIKLKGGPKYPGNLINRTSDGGFVYWQSVMDPMYEYVYITTMIYRYDKDGKFVAAWDVRKSMPNPGSYIGDFKLTQENTLAAYHSHTKEVLFFDLEGNLVSRFTPETTSKLSYADKLYLRPDGNLMLFDYRDKYAQIYDLDGNLKQRFRLRGQEKPDLTVSLFFDRKGNIYTNNSDKHTIAKFGPKGRFIKDIAPNDLLVVPAKMLRSNTNQYCGEYIDLGPDGNIYLLDRNRKQVNILNQKGVLQGSFKLPEGYYFLPAMRVRSDNSIAMIFEYTINIYNKDGKKIDEWQEIPHARDLDVASDDSVYVISMRWGETHLVKFSKDGEILFDKMLWGEKDFQLKYPNSVAVSKNGEVHVLDGTDFIKVFSSKGDFLRKVSLPFGAEGIEFNKDDQYIVHNWGFIYILDQNGKQHQTFLGDHFDYANDVAQNSQGRYFIPNFLDDHVLSFNVSKPFETNMPTGKINGMVDLKSMNQTWMVPVNVYIQGKDPAGNDFYGMTETNNTGYFSFSGIPLNSKYRIWTDQMVLGQHHLKKPMLKGVIKKEDNKKTFKSEATPPNYVSIFGIAKNKAGVPLNGVIISCGRYKTCTSLDGRYKLTLPGDSVYSLTAEKEGYAFKKDTRKITLATDDKLFVNFTEK